jgi:hypothetical protein
MIGFLQAVIKNPSRSLIMVNKAGATVTTQNYLMSWNTGLAENASSGSGPEDLIGVCNQTIAAAEALTQVPIIELFENDVWLVDCTNNSVATDNGQRMVLGANAYTVNNTHTTSAVGIVEQVDVFGATGDKKILVKFVTN